MDCDVLIVGGGLVGSSLVCALDGGGMRVAQAEAAAPAPQSGSIDPLDQRHFALARRSVLALESIGVWAHARDAAHPIRAVEVSSRGDFGTVRIDAGELALDALGHTVPAPALGAALARRVSECRSLERLAPAKLVAIEPGDEAIVATLEHAGERRAVRAKLVVGADGTESTLRTLANIGARRHDYGQTAIASAVQLSKPHDGVAFERFTDTGPIALLPLAGNRAGLIWTVARDEAAAVLALDDARFVEALQQRFGFRAGRFVRAGKRQPWPLALTAADALTGPRLALVGNAAQTVHPLGAQGFNLGLRDAMALVERVRGAADPGDLALLGDYAAARAGDRAATMDFSDGLTRLFSRGDALTRAARGAGLATIARLAPLKHELAFAMMGWRS